MITNYSEVTERTPVDKINRTLTLEEAIKFYDSNCDRFGRWLTELKRSRETLDKLEEAFHEMTDWDFIEFCKKLWGVIWYVMEIRKKADREE